MARERLVVIGNGMAGLTLLEEIARRAPERFAITVFGAEPVPAYDRVALSAWLAGDAGDEDLMLRPAHWYAEHGIALRTGTKVAAIRPCERLVELDGGDALPYDRLVIATGSEAARPDLPGAGLAHVFRDRDDAEALRHAAGTAERAVVIGGGLLGIEAAAGLNRLGMDVTIVHLADRLMERQLDRGGAAFLLHALEAQGIRVVLGARTAALEGDDAVRAVRLADGCSLGADLAVFAVGTRPAAGLARTAGLAVGRGIVVDGRMTTVDPHIHAVGECAEHEGMCCGLVAPAREQAHILAAVLCGEDAHYRPAASATHLKVSGVPVFSAGAVDAAEGDEEIVLSDPASGEHRRFLMRGGAMIGCALVGETSDAHWYESFLVSGEDLSARRGDIAFGRAFCEAA